MLNYLKRKSNRTKTLENYLGCEKLHIGAKIRAVSRVKQRYWN